MLTYADFNRITAHITYKKGYCLRLKLDDAGRPYLQVSAFLPCQVTGEVETQAGRKWSLSQHMVVAEVVRTAHKAFRAFEEHECDEAFKYRKQAIYGPHISPDKLAEFLALKRRSALQYRDQDVNSTATPTPSPCPASDTAEKSIS